ncbi:ATP-binding protein [Longibacter salinarum]|nr:transporter substrate-binding domain-containing protein [Longibacter salinarum]
MLRYALLLMWVGVCTICPPAVAQSQAFQDGRLDLTAEEREWVDSNPVIRHVVIPDYAPVESYSEIGKAVGIAPDYLAEVAGRLSLRVEHVEAPTWSAALDSIREGKADLTTAIQKTESRDEYMAFTQPFLSVPDVLLVREQADPVSMDNLDGVRVAIVDRYAANSDLRRQYPGAEFQIVPDIRTGLEKTAFGSVDGMVLSLPVASATIERAQITNLRVAGATGYVYNLRFGVRHDRAMLRSVLDKALSSLTASTHRSIYERWVSFDSSETGPESGTWWYSISLVLGGLLVVLGAGAAWNWSLRHEVERRTEELERARAEAEEMNRLKSAFLANMNHEFRTPLTAIIGFSDTLLSQDPDESTKQLLRYINESGRRLGDALESLLHFAQLESDSMMLETERFSASIAVKEVADRYREEAAYENLTLDVELPDRPIQAHADRPAFQRILGHLLSNAIKFTDEGGAVTVRLIGDERDVIVEVEDTGVGIDPAFFPRLYDAFEQESGGDKREFDGVGLGLAIARTLTEKMDGRIRLESEKGQGSRFTVRIPRYPSDTADSEGRSRGRGTSHRAPAGSQQTA